MIKIHSLLLPTLLCIPVSAIADNYTEPRDTAAVETQKWTEFSDPLELTWASKDIHHRQFKNPEASPVAISDTTVTAWRGERIGLEALLISTVSTGPLKVNLSELKHAGKTVSMPGCYAAFMRYVITTAYNTCGYPDANLPTYTVPDMIDLPGTSVEMEPQSVRPIWCSVEIPHDITPGLYTATLSVSDKKNKVLGSLTLNIDINQHSLPAPKDYSFYLDMWQQPYAISRYYNVEPWSKEHFEHLAPYADMLARAGQKTVSVILFYEPWGEQSNDKFEPMVQTTKTKDGAWAYDYSILDNYVEFMAGHGIDKNISCFTMIPWDMQFRYFDENTGKYEFLSTKTSSPEYEALWTDFLLSLTAHLKEKGWFEKSLIVMDERGLPDMLNAFNVAKKAVPDIKMSLAGNYHDELVNELESYTVIKGDFFPDDVLASRRAKGWTSLMYTCCATPAPSQFSNSDTADGAYLPVYSTATGFDGYLHWSFTNWTDNPLTDTRFHMFAPGDTYFVYPDSRSSIRYERMLEGIQMSEKIRILRNEFTQNADIDGLAALEEALTPIRSGAMTTYYPTSKVINSLQKAIDKLSKRHK